MYAILKDVLSNKIAECARRGKTPIGGWRSVYAILKDVHTDWVRHYSNEPPHFTYYYGLLLTTAVWAGCNFDSNQRNNLERWLDSYFQWRGDPYLDDTDRA